MKIRTGFVSNSSSSSFILTGSFKDIMEAIENMIGLVDSDYTEGGAPDHLAGLVTFKNNEDLQDEFKEGNLGVAFSSCNYDTYMKVRGCKDNGKYRVYVETCNNHDWSGVIKQELITRVDDECSDEYNSMYRDNRAIGCNFIWISENCIIRSAEHYLFLHTRINFKCDCTKRYKVSVIRFDESLRAHCSQCDAPLGETATAKRKRLKKPQDYPDNIIPGVI